MLEHSCSGGGRRKRGYPAVIMELIALKQLTGFVPPTKGSAVTQFQKTAKKAGVVIGQTVSRKLLENLSGNRKLDSFSQYASLPYYVSEKKRCDPEGTYLLRTSGTTGNNRFESFIQATGAAKRIWLLLRNSSSVDGMRYKNITGGCILGETGLTANNGLVPLMQMICYSENKANCLLFLAQSDIDFPIAPPRVGRLRWIDRGVALIAAFNELQFDWRACTQHIVKDVKDKFSSTPAKLVDSIYALARCTTEAEYDRQIARIKSSEDFKSFKKLDDLLDYLHNIHEQFVSAWYLERGYSNLTQIASNPAEQFNKWSDDLRKKAIISFFDGVQDKYVEKLAKVCYLSAFCFGSSVLTLPFTS